MKHDHVTTTEKLKNAALWLLIGTSVGLIVSGWLFLFQIDWSRFEP